MNTAAALGAVFTVGAYILPLYLHTRVLGSLTRVLGSGGGQTRDCAFNFTNVLAAVRATYLAPAYAQRMSDP